MTINPVLSMDGEVVNNNASEIKVQKEETTEINKVETLKTLGYFHEDTKQQDINKRNAIIRFQSEHNLTVDGIYGPQSETVLSALVNGSERRYLDVIDQPPTKGKWMTINKTKRILTLYEGDKVMKKYPVAQGKEPGLTPEGKFTIVNKLVNPGWGGAGIAQPVKGGSPNNPLGYRWMGINHGGGGSYGIHGNNNPRSIGTNASLGCVRMINSDVAELFDIISLKTPVWIGTHEKLKEWGVDQKSYLGYIEEIRLAEEKATKEKQAIKQAEIEKAKQEEAMKQAEIEKVLQEKEESNKQIEEPENIPTIKEYLEYINGIQH
ncbi:L,D-transpeptidase family protein [Alkaliphilus metalliredigens]|nr:L,D-transpeptidase family protein [Alkaliphilus metalliredigens]